MSVDETKETVEEPVLDLPSEVLLNDLRKLSHLELRAIQKEIGINTTASLTKAHLVFDIATFYVKNGVTLICEGMLEGANEKFSMMRDPQRSFKTSPDDCYLSSQLVKEFGLKNGQKLKVHLRAPSGRDKFLTVSELLEIEGIPAKDFQAGLDFEYLTSMYPEERLQLEIHDKEHPSPTGRVLDLVAPLGKGQRSLIVAPPRGGKTMVLKNIALAIEKNHPEAELMVLLLDERPEEVTDFEETIDGATVYASTFDEPPKRHAQVADMVLERAKRLVEQKKDVILLLDSLTRLARGFNNSTGGGAIMSGGLKPAALQRARKFFSTARNVEEGGSLTIVATSLVETESRMDDIVFEELKGTGNMEVKLDREFAEMRIFPAVHLFESGTRNDERLYHEEEFQRVIQIRKQLSSVPAGEALEKLLNNIALTASNAEILIRGLK